MSVALPTSPGPAATTPGYLDVGGVLRPILGGAHQKLNRLGDRFMIDVQMPPMPSAGIAMGWVADLVRASREGALFQWPQLGFDPGTPGAPLVNGGGQAGMTLSLKGMTPGYGVVKGQFLSIIVGGRRYLEMVTADATVGVHGTVTLAIAPMLRVSPPDNAPCEIAEPMIEGFLDGDERRWTVDVARHTGLSFSITEAK